jgi:hypothetical protein
MRPFLFLLLFTGYLSAQDSLFWFDMNSVRDPVPKTPKILDKIFGTSQFGLLDSLKNIRITTQEGYRLQIFESSSVEEANRTLRKFERSLKDSVYMVFEAPLYKLRLGNFVTKKEAEEQKANLNKKGYKNIWIVRSRIEQSSLD